jgi:nucleoside-diphosphate-sugar epimerase
MKNVLITGALGQLGTEIASELAGRLGSKHVILSDIRDDEGQRAFTAAFTYYRLDCRDDEKLTEIIRSHQVDTIYHLAAILSARAEASPQNAWDVNMNGLMTVLEAARENRCAVFTPSSIGAFGPTTPKDYTPQDTIQRPTSMYGISKVAGELLCDYYHHTYDVDTRGVRFPGIISNLTPPGGGTTDYAVEIFYAAVTHGGYECPLAPDTYLDMMYMPDAVRAAVEIMEADSRRLRHRNAFNVTAMSFSPEELAAYIRNFIPEFQITYRIDPLKQAIANSWPNMLEDYAARVEWGWKPEYDLHAMTEDMIKALRRRQYNGEDLTKMLG